MRHLKKAGGWTRRERLRCLWYRLRLIVQVWTIKELPKVERVAIT
jgi:hypothetical protein